jgi:lipopolysaccharide export system permease protein
VVRLVAAPTIAGFALLTLLISAYNAADLLRDAAYSNLTGQFLAMLVLLRDVQAAEVLLPTALYIAVLAAVNQWHREREAFACYAAGVRPARISRAIAALCVVVAIAVAGLTLFARPWAYAETYRIDRATMQLSTSAMQADRFYPFGPATVISAREIDPDGSRMHDVFLENRQEGGVRIIRAESGRLIASETEGRRRLELEAGTSHFIDHDTLADRITKFETLVYYAANDETGPVNNPRRARATLDLWQNAANGKEVAELQWRFLHPLTALLLSLIAIAVARALPGTSAYPRYIAALLLYALVFNLSAVGRTWVENGQVGALPGMLWVPAMTAVIGIIASRLPRLSFARPQ